MPVGTKYFFAVPRNPMLFSVRVPFTSVALCLNMQVNDFTPSQSLCKASVLVTFHVSFTNPECVKCAKRSLSLFFVVREGSFGSLKFLF